MYYVSIHYVPTLMAWYVWVYPQRAYSLTWETTQRTKMAQYEVQFCRPLLRTTKTSTSIGGGLQKSMLRQFLFSVVPNLSLTSTNFSWLKCLSKKHCSSVHYNLLSLFYRNHVCRVKPFKQRRLKHSPKPSRHHDLRYLTKT